MADLADVENVVQTIVASTIYPNGTAQPSAIIVNSASVNCRVVTGWPLPDNLDADLAAGVVTVSVHAQPGLEKNTTRYPTDWYLQQATTPTLTATVSGSTITIGGSITAGHFVTAVVGNAAFSYAAQENDTLDTVATALAALIDANTAASASGAVITVAPTNNGVLIARVGAPQISARELERTDQRVLVTVWAPSNAARVATARLIRPILAKTDVLTYPDNTCGRFKYEMSADIDRSGKQSALCRDMFYWAEYPVVETMVSYPLTAPVTGIEIDGWTSPDFTPLPWNSFTAADTVTS